MDRVGPAGQTFVALVDRQHHGEAGDTPIDLTEPEVPATRIDVPSEDLEVDAVEPVFGATGGGEALVGGQQLRTQGRGRSSAEATVDKRRPTAASMPPTARLRSPRDMTTSGT